MDRNFPNMRSVAFQDRRVANSAIVHLITKLLEYVEQEGRCRAVSAPTASETHMLAFRALWLGLRALDIEPAIRKKSAYLQSGVTVKFHASWQLESIVYL
jgi:hypothetical protein